MLHLTAICFLKSNPVYHRTNKGDYVTVRIAPSNWIGLSGGNDVAGLPRPTIMVIANAKTQCAQNLLQAKSGDFASIFGELYLQTFKNQKGGISVKLVCKAYRIEITPNKKMAMKARENSIENKKTFDELELEMQQSETPLEEIEDPI